MTTPLGFAHRGGCAHQPENSAAAFTAAVQAGVRGLESDVRLTRDDVPVLQHDARRGWRSGRPVHEVDAADLDPSVVTLARLLSGLGRPVHLSLDLKVPGAAEPVVAVADAVGHPRDHLWLCETLARLPVAGAWPGVRLVDSTRRRALGEPPARRAARLAAAGVAALNMHRQDWDAAAVRAVQEQGVLALGWGCTRRAHVVALVALGVDALYADDPADLPDLGGVS